MPRVRDTTFVPEILAIHERAHKKAKELEDFSFSWLDEILREAKKVFAENDVHLLPKTPSAKAASRRRRRSPAASRRKIEVDEEEAESNETNGVSTDDAQESTPKAPARRTRASRKPTAAAKTQKTRSRRGAKKDSEDNIDNKDVSIESEASQEEMDTVDTTNKTPQPTTETNTSPVNEHIIKKIAEPITADLQTPIRNFSTMNVKEKVHAYEDIISHAPCPSTTHDVHDNESSHTNMECAKTPLISDMQRTPATVTRKSAERKSSLPKTPENAQVVSSPGTVKVDTPILHLTTKRKSTPRLSAHGRKSLRASLRASLKCLPSEEKIAQVECIEVAAKKPGRPRTRLKLKKKTCPDVETTESCDVIDDQETVRPATCTPNKVQVEDKKMDEESEKDEDVKDEVEPKEDDSDARMETEEGKDHVNGKEDGEPVPAPTRSTRTKTRAAQVETNNVHQEAAVSSVVETAKPRVTRSKMRKPQEESTVTASPAPSEHRVTRTKTRKRQHEDEPESELNTSKRQCVEDDGNDNSLDNEDEILNVKVVKPHPKSFLNSLKPVNNPVRPNNLNPGLVKSFIARNSPAKPSLKEIQEKKKQELLEKTRKNEERMKQRDEEYRKKMEEMKRKREEKMKKVLETRDLKQQQEKENRLVLQRKLEEKRQLTNKMKEERLREEKEKQRIRLQKTEEAEDRRKQEEIERQKRLQEQIENEKYHNEWLQRKKECEEMERQKKIEEEKHKILERHQMEKEREKERLRLLKLEEEKRKEWQKKKEERERQLAEERAEKERQQLEAKRERELELKKEAERLKKQERQRLAEQEQAREEERLRQEEIRKMTEKHNSQLQQQQSKGLPKPNLNKTHSLEEASVPQPPKRNDSYEMTPPPIRPNCQSTNQNYNINDLSSGDETDDECAPRKKVPDWAQGDHLKSLLVKQHYEPPKLDVIFGAIPSPDLNALFEKKKARFNRRTSSAHWDSPIIKPGNLRPLH